ncbi:hypothetical protein [Prosthecobacter sp.]|uniref:hypothetical protein n=1 Tax=Prosthecobacter sp. TaxID=1965333 RepID=UPI0037838C22
MAFIFSTSHLPETRTRRPDHLEEVEEEDDENMQQPPPRAGMVRAFSHQPEPRPLADTSGPLSTRPATPVGRPRPHVDPGADVETDEGLDTDHAPEADSDHESGNHAHEYENDTPWHMPRIAAQDRPPQGRDEDETGPHLNRPVRDSSFDDTHSAERSASTTRSSGFSPSPQDLREFFHSPAGEVPAQDNSPAMLRGRIFEKRLPPGLLGQSSGQFQSLAGNPEYHDLVYRPGSVEHEPHQADVFLQNVADTRTAREAPARPKAPQTFAQNVSPASKPPPGTANGAVAANASAPGSGDPDQRSNISIHDDQKSPFAQAVQDALNKEIEESPTTAAIMKAVRSLPNKIRIVPKTANGEATMSIGDDGTVTIQINLQELSGATFGHELSHVIQRVAFKNEYKKASEEAPAHPDPKQPTPFERARKKASEALNQIIKVAYRGDSGDDYTENEAVRVSNIVTAERTAAKIKEQFKGRTNVTPEEIARAFWLEARKLEEGKHFRNTHAIPMLTRYGNHDFTHVANTLGNGVTPEMLKKVRNSMDQPPYQTFYMPPAPASQPAKRPR